jgi:hypothetical protein
MWTTLGFLAEWVNPWRPDRFQNSSNNGKPLIEARIGALIALEHLANDSPGDRPRVLELISAYIRNNVRWKPFLKNEFYGPWDDKRLKKPVRSREDILAALRVLSRTHKTSDPSDTPIDLSKVNLAKYDLSKLDLSHISLKSSNLSESILEKVDLRGANLEDSWLWKANLKGASVRGVSWRNANVSGADFSETDISTEIFFAKYHWEALFDKAFHDLYDATMAEKRADFESRRSGYGS